MTTTFFAAKILKKIGELLELSKENEFKIKAYYNAERILKFKNEPLSTFLSQGKVKGIGKQIVSDLEDLRKGTKPEILERLEDSIPKGLIELLKIKGLGAKKILKLHSDLKINSPKDLLTSIETGEILSIKGFAEKNTVALKQSLEFFFSNLGYFRLDHHEKVLNEILTHFSKAMPNLIILPCAESETKSEVYSSIQLITIDKRLDEVSKQFEILGFIQRHESRTKSELIFVREDIKAKLSLTTEDEFNKVRFLKSCSDEYLKDLQSSSNFDTALETFSDDISVYQQLQLPYLAPELRHEFIKHNKEYKLITRKDLKGIIHCHSNYSDGANSIADMAEASKTLGYQYLTITDHSVSAHYANGLSVERIQKQQLEIKNLNSKLKDFFVFSGIESDILKDGDLDYENEVLDLFDLVIASVHTNFELDKLAMTNRILKAISYPQTTILAHPTGRLLLQRRGYEIDLDKIFSAAKEHQVIIELNCNPKRLDLNWKDLALAKELGLEFCISPDAHATDQLEFIEYGIMMARKAGLEPVDVINCLDQSEFNNFLCKKN